MRNQLRELISGRLYEEVYWLARKRLTVKQYNLFIYWLENREVRNCNEIRKALHLSVSVRAVQITIRAAFERMENALAEKYEGTVKIKITVAHGHKCKGAVDHTLKSVMSHSQEIG